ncbi:MAG TPA: ribosome biogenesis GTP-binding protein YihA/YsxC [Gammaproteobacteria bacterium]|jgi:GTP-binding protein|nr:ribosome biogenesis GTP-binding protein YihA/YsxC [Gammaproteobacteria bacterium]
MSSHYQKAYFLLSAAEVKQLPPDYGVEIAMVGRSNAGKSSVLNRITRQGQLARVSKTPGRTQLINVFVIDENRRLIDLPGYGFAKAPLAAKRKWEEAIDAYIRGRESLKGVVLIMDIRHPLKDLDVNMLDYCESADLKVHVLLNKADKLSKGAGKDTLLAVQAALAPYGERVSVQLFSALTSVGLEELYKVLGCWYGYVKV